jgi:hypothetical protein
MVRRLKPKKQKRWDRKCGTCTACCTTLGVKAIPVEGGTHDKEPGEECPHLTEVGCAIYDDRPQECRTFRCAWMDQPKAFGGPETRPDELGVIFYGSATNIWERSLVAQEIREDALDGDKAQELMERGAIGSGLCVSMTIHGHVQGRTHRPDVQARIQQAQGRLRILESK